MKIGWVHLVKYILGVTLLGTLLLWSHCWSTVTTINEMQFIRQYDDKMAEAGERAARPYKVPKVWFSEVLK